MRLLILGVTGMLGSAAFSVFREEGRHDVWGTMRDRPKRRFFSEAAQSHLVDAIDVLDEDALTGIVSRIRPDVIVNCVGLIKQLAAASDPLVALPINSMLPHRLARLCGAGGARLVHISTDCVFSGRAGSYREEDLSDAEDLYGKSKFIGELHDYPNAVTLRTSIIGHELDSRHGLVDWFLSSRGSVPGYRRAVFSGLPSVELARVIRDCVLPRPELRGLYHVSAAPITKFDLLTLVAGIYGKDIEVVPDDSVAIDRSLNSERFSTMTGYHAPEWPTLITMMRTHHTNTITSIA